MHATPRRPLLPRRNSQVCRRRALSFFFYKLAMTGFVLDLALDLDTLTMSPWLASLVLVVALTAVARRRRERCAGRQG